MRVASSLRSEFAAAAVVGPMAGQGTGTAVGVQAQTLTQPPTKTPPKRGLCECGCG